jgi:phosphoesterase RecJ-like protein
MSQLHDNDLSSLHQWLRDATARGPVAVVTGKNGDMDTVGSAIALSSTHPNFMACGIHLGRVARRLVEAHHAPFRQIKSGHEQWPSSISAVVVVDAAAADQTGLELPDVPKCILDHHATDDWQLSDGDFSMKWDVRSTTEMVARYMLGYAKEQMTGPVCEFLLAGLVTDTGRFRHANAGSFEIASSLLIQGHIDYQSFIESMEDERPSPSEQGAMLRGLQRTELTEAGPWRVLRSTAGTLEGRVASLLSGIGADAVVVTRHRHGETRLTVRASRSSVLNGLHLGTIMEGLSESLGGEGGGHDGAAGWSGQANPIAAESAFIDAVARTKRGK